MTWVGALATVLYAITIATVAAGFGAYAVYKLRERSRAPKRTRAPLVFFVEYQAAPESPAIAPRASARWPLLGAALVVLGALGGVSARGRVVSRSPLHVGARALPDVTRFAPTPASLFPYPSLDANGDGAIDDAERARIHDVIPQLVLVTCDDNGSVSGLEWVRSVMGEHAARVTYFMTTNYMDGHPNWMGGDVDAWWQLDLSESYIGLHGTTHQEGGQAWTRERWLDELGGARLAMAKKLTAPWAWERYPWGSRAPFLVVDEGYFQALDALGVTYDASLVMRARKPPKGPNEPRDAPWPFTLDLPLPPELDDAGYSDMNIKPHPIFEIPVYAWAFDTDSGVVWQPSLDHNLFKRYPCAGAEANDAAVTAVLANLDAHERGNRAPFHLGLHAQNYGEDKACERATVARVLAGIAERAHTRFVAAPELVEWMIKHGHARR